MAVRTAESVSSTPRGSPVEPDVDTTATTSSRSSGTAGSSGRRAARIRSAYTSAPPVTGTGATAGPPASAPASASASAATPSGPGTTATSRSALTSYALAHGAAAPATRATTGRHRTGPAQLAPAPPAGGRPGTTGSRAPHSCRARRPAHGATLGLGRVSTAGDGRVMDAGTTSAAVVHPPDALAELGITQVVAYALPLTRTFRRTTVREGVLLRGPGRLGGVGAVPGVRRRASRPAGWPPGSRRRRAGWPAPLRAEVAVNAIVPALPPTTPRRSHERRTSSPAARRTRSRSPSRARARRTTSRGWRRYGRRCRPASGCGSTRTAAGPSPRRAPCCRAWVSWSTSSSPARASRTARGARPRPGRRRRGAAAGGRPRRRPAPSPPSAPPPTWWCVKAAPLGGVRPALDLAAALAVPVGGQRRARHRGRALGRDRACRRAAGPAVRCRTRHRPAARPRRHVPTRSSRATGCSQSYATPPTPTRWPPPPRRPTGSPGGPPAWSAAPPTCPEVEAHRVARSAGRPQAVERGGVAAGGRMAA